MLPRCWVNVEPRAPGGYLSPRGSECSPVGIPPTHTHTSSLLPPLLGEAEGIWIGGSHLDPVGPLPAKDPGEVRGESQGLTCLFN